jgi:hypothetical protein
MRWKSVVVQSVKSDGSLVAMVGHPLADAYLEESDSAHHPPISGKVAAERVVGLAGWISVDSGRLKWRKLPMSALDLSTREAAVSVRRSPQIRG